MSPDLPPGSLLLAGAWLLAPCRGRWRTALVLTLPVLSALHLAALPADHTVETSLFGYTLLPVRIDRLSLVWGVIFHVAAFASALYALHVKDRLFDVAALTYAGAAIGAVFAGDLITLFIYWELTAVSSVFLIWGRRRDAAYRAGFRYLVLHVASGVLLLAGAVLLFHHSGSLSFRPVDIHSPGAVLLLLAFGIKCGFPLLHAWMPDAYPKSTPAGTVWLSIFTTKLAVYALARSFAGLELLLAPGAVMALAPLLYAAVENDLRRVLTYSLINQLGFMVIGIGIGTPLALNGVAAHAFCHILYKSLLFMAVGSVIFQVGHARASALGGLYRDMPWTALCCLVGSASIAAVPLFSGFVSKTLIISAAGESHRLATYLTLLVASALAVAAADLRVPYAAFFGDRRGAEPVRTSPWNMRLAMGAVALLCIGLGLFPGVLYRLLPYPVDYHPYTLGHVLSKLQLLLFPALAFALLVQRRRYPDSLPGVLLDADWFYRRPAPGVARSVGGAAARGFARAAAAGRTFVLALDRLVRALAGPTGMLARTWSTGGMVIWAALLLTLCLVVYYLS